MPTTRASKDACDLLDADHKAVKKMLDEAEVEHQTAKDLIAQIRTGGEEDEIEARKEELLSEMGAMA